MRLGVKGHPMLPFLRKRYVVCGINTVIGEEGLEPGRHSMCKGPEAREAIEVSPFQK